MLRSKSAIYGTSAKPRVSVFRSNKSVYAQVIDDVAGKTLLSADNRKNKKNDMETIKQLGVSLAKEMLAKKIDKIVYDRGKYRYHGKIKSFADGLREGGIKF